MTDRKLYRQDWYRQNRERLIQKSKEYYWKNRIDIKIRDLDRRKNLSQEDIQKWKDYAKNYRITHKEYFREYSRKYYQKKREKAKKLVEV